MTRKLHDLIVVGGGIGGLVAALSLARRGHSVHVLEKAPVFEEIGAGLQLAPNASRALDKLGLLEAATRDAFFPKRLVLRDAMTGEEITALSVDDEFVEEFGYPYFVTHRADLHRAIYEACQAEDKISLTPAAEVVEVDDDGSRVKVTTTDGTSYHADALVGADGLWSTVRKTVFGVNEPPVDSGYVAYRGTAPMVSPAAGGKNSSLNDMVVWCGPSMHLVQYPVRRGALRNQVATLMPAAYPTANKENLAAQLHAAFKDTVEAVSEDAAQMDTSKRWVLVDRNPLERWSKGRVTLLGDAAHPMLQFLAQGACQAIEDAVVLAECLAESDSPSEAFSTYEKHRLPRASRVQANARRFGEIVHMEGTGARIRNLFLEQFGAHDYSPLRWLYSDNTERAGGALPLNQPHPVTPDKQSEQRTLSAAKS